MIRMWQSVIHSSAKVFYLNSRHSLAKRLHTFIHGRGLRVAQPDGVLEPETGQPQLLGRYRGFVGLGACLEGS